MKLDISCFCFLSKNEYRVLTAIEMGMKNHEYLDVQLIASIANLRKEGIMSVLKKLLKNKLISHENKIYDGYKLTYLGYDFLALRAFLNRGILKSVGNQIGVGKESDIYICKDVNDNLLCLKIHRLGRISFRTIKNNRDYYGKKKFRNWLYLSKIAATKEYAYLKALYENDFPVPKPYDLNRHMILMSYVNGYPLSHVKISNPFKVIDFLLNTIIKFARSDIIHGDFNEFNILIDDNENITIIDFPQIVSLHHENGKMYFERDVKCVINHFYKKYKIRIEDYPLYEDIASLENEKIIKDENNISSKHDNALLEILQNDKSDYETNLSDNESAITVQNDDKSTGNIAELDDGINLQHENNNTTEHDSKKNEKSSILKNNKDDTFSDMSTNYLNDSLDNQYKDVYENNQERETENNKLYKREDTVNEHVDNILETKHKELILNSLNSISDKENDTPNLVDKNCSNQKNYELDDNYEDIPSEQKVSPQNMEHDQTSDSDDNLYDENSSEETSDHNENDLTEYSSCDSSNSQSGETKKKLSDTWNPHIKKYTKEYAKSKLKYMDRKKKKKEKFKENLKTKNKKKLMEKIKNYM
ncbi:serine/threonine protein kinase RIO2, putative [Plasmodium chabaudi chabaudi]|uniref:Serine/threonine-protein kinase RIO2 n=1 Tax=Plasmodium chabaudi chabaudi TaxID=31271 RepID=A0A077XBM8_PLACU|nr:serine/threonine protein kinase RIO2, putative [Plasmodium chabaudi chabaudi]SCL99756.1 serine/threonine protein kinase RIO2, putative [Plasmodium chabaudi chabaudi]VTZ67552.1 serine/threonine protein kinase RIO2, putative [Plasmodium chabaudi chabaudi]|eukprot:XP_744933.2 serine/threonine protein kinase RIO2, putative [Plasmodium chabaudi chabaudi]